jgi:hypothetical protein
MWCWRGLRLPDKPLTVPEGFRIVSVSGRWRHLDGVIAAYHASAGRAGLCHCFARAGPPPQKVFVPCQISAPMWKPAKIAASG